MLNSFRDWMKVIACGVCMGLANIVPGVSGGTMAFILGIYAEVLDSIKSIDGRAVKLLVRGRWGEAFQQISWRFLLALALGGGFALVAFAKGMSFLLQHPTYRAYLFAVFFGLILASAAYCARQVGGWRPQRVLALFVGVIAAFALTGINLDSTDRQLGFDVHVSHERIVLPHEEMNIQNYSAENSALMGVSHATLSAMIAKNVIGKQTMVYSHEQHKMGRAEEFVQAGSYSFLEPWIIFCGMMTVCAMLLPGISGSYMLVVFGSYALIVGAVADFVHSVAMLKLNIGALATLLNFCGGMVLGAIGFARVVSWLLSHYRAVTIATLTGFMLGAIRAVWPFWSYEYRLAPLMLDKGPQLVSMQPRLPGLSSPELLITVGLALLGFASVMALEVVAGKKKQEV